MIYCTYNVSVSEEIMKILEVEEISNFQIMENVLAKTEGSEPRYNTPVWPGLNNSLFIQANDDEFDRFYNRIEKHNEITDDENEQVLINSWKID